MKESKKKKFISFCEQKKLNKKDIDLFKKTIKFLEKKSKDKLNENLEIAKILIDNEMPGEVICSGILFGIESFSSIEEIKKEFKEEILEIIQSQINMKEVKTKARKNSSEVIRQIILSAISDIRVITIKLASKLAELKRIEEDSKENKKIANEVIEIYVPIATRLEINKLKKELIDSAFKIINRKKYEEIEKYLKDSKEQRETYIKETIQKFKDLLNPSIKKIKIKGREKQLYSIYEKIRKRKVPLHEQKDHFAMRIVTDTKENCYNVLSIINKKYKNIPKTLKDYIKNPKDNGYQSIHTAIKIDGKTLEVQIRTEKMDQDAEEGRSSHWAYKKLNSSKNFEKKTEWLRGILKLQNQKPLKNLRLNFFRDKIYCYTPMGKSFEMPKGSTVLDFAYYVHAEVGNTATGGRVNNKFVPLKKELEDGDTVEIITNKFQRPRRDWMKFVATKYAKKIIARTVKKYENLPVTKKVSLSKKKETKLENLVDPIDFPNHKTSFAKCCNPLPEEKIIGIIKSHKNILVHKKECSRIKESKKHYVKVIWKKIFENPIKVLVETKDRSGILADILNTISKKGIKITETNAKLTGNGMAECLFLTEIESKEKLIEVINSIKKVKDTKKIFIETD